MYVELYENLYKHPDNMMVFMLKLINKQKHITPYITPKNYMNLAIKIIKLFEYLKNGNLLQNIINEHFHEYFKLANFGKYYYSYTINFTNKQQPFIFNASIYNNE